MFNQSPFYYKVVLHQDTATSNVVAQLVTALPLDSTELVTVLLGDVGHSPQGLYVNIDGRWIFALPYPEFTYSIVRGDVLHVYTNVETDSTAPTNSDVFKNGIQQMGLAITAGEAVYVAKTPPSGGSGGGAVDSVNNMTGAVVVNAANLPGLATVGRTGSYSDLSNLPAAYSLPVATVSVLGGVIVPSASNLVIDGAGNIDVKAALLTTINNKLSSVVTSGTGTSLIQSLAAGTATLKSLLAGAGTALADDGLGNVTISATPYALPTASASVLGGIKIGAGLTVDGTGVLSATAQALTPATVSTLGGVKVGSGLNVAGDGNLTLGVATSSALGGVKQGAGVSIAGDGTLSASLPIATASVLGGVKQGAGLAVAGDGTLSLGLATASVVGGVKVGSGLSVDGTGLLTANAQALAPATTTVLGGVIVPVASNLTVDGSGNVDVKAALLTTINAKVDSIMSSGGANSVVRQRTGNNVMLNDLVAGANITIADNGTGGLVITGTTYALPTASASVLGGIKVGSGLAIDGTGVLSATAGSTTLTGDVTGAGTGNIATTLSNTGVVAGAYTKVTVDAKGRVTLGANPTTLVGYGITDALNSLTGGSVAGTITLTGGSTLTGVPTPVANSDAANRGYVDAAVAAIVNGTSWRANAQVTTTANVLLTGLQTIDGYLTIAGDRVLVKDQTDPTENGVYLAAVGAWSRALDTDTGGEIMGMAILVLNGTVNSFTQWVNTNTSTITIGTTPINYTKLQGEGVLYTAGAGLALTGNVFSIANTGVAANTYTKVTVNAQGQVTAGAQLASLDVTTALGFTPLQNNQAITLSGDATGTGSTAITVVLANTAVTAGTYGDATHVATFTVDGKGRLTSAGSVAITGAVSSVFGQTGAIPNLSGDITTAGSSVTSLSNTGVSANTYTKVTVDVKGRVTVGANLNFTDVTTGLGFTPVNKAGDTISGALNAAPSVSIVAGATTNIGAAGSNNVIITTNTTITAFDTIAAGARRTVTFQGTPLLTNNAISLILPTGGNIQTVAGDTAEFLSLGGPGNWMCLWYQRKSGQSLVATNDTTKLALSGGTMTGAINGAPAVTLASAGTVNIGGAAANDVTVTGTTAITAFDTIAASAVRKVTFTGILTLTNNAVSLILPTGANIQTAVGDVAQFTSLGAGNWRCDFYTRANGQSLVGAPDATKLPLAGGTMTGPINEAPTMSLASAATVNIGAATANDIIVTGTTSITAFDTLAAGATRRLTFAAVLTLTYNAVSLILPGTANIITAPNDAAEFVSLGAGNWRCVDYQRANGQSLVATADASKLSLTGGTLTGAVNEAATVQIVAAATTTIGATPSNNVAITTNTTITAFDTIAAGATRTVTFQGIPLLTHNAVSLILPTGANIQTVAGDSAEFLSLGAGNWKCLWYQRANGQSLVGAPDATKLPLAGGTMTGAINGAPPVTLASAATVNIGAAAANDVSVTGAVTITAFDTIAAGAVRKITFAAALTLTHNATSLILPTGANVTTGAGDVAQFTSLGAGNWRCDFYTKAGGVFATLSGAETLSNKTLSNANITGFIESGSAFTGSTFTPDFTTGTDFEYTTTANTLITLPAAAAGRSYTITIKYGGAHTVTFAGGTLIKYPGGVAPTPTSVNGKWDVYVMKCDRAATATIVNDGGRNF